MKAFNDNTTFFRQPDARAALVRFLTPLLAAPGNESHKAGFMFARDDQLAEGARLATSDYLRHASGFAGIDVKLCRGLKRASGVLVDNFAGEDIEKLLVGDLNRTAYGHEPNRRAAELAQTALKPVLFMEDVLSAAVELEMTLAPAAPREDVRQHLYTRLARATVEKAAPPQPPHPDERGAMGLGALLRHSER